MDSKFAPLHFEQAEPSDIDFLLKKTLALHEFETEGDPGALQTSNNFESEVRDWLLTELQSPSSLIFTVQYQQKKVGFAFLKIIPNPNAFTVHQQFGLIQSIWIETEHRKQNFGQKVVSFIESVFKEQGISYYEVNYATSNKTAEEFWKACGLVASSVTARKFLA